MRVVWLDGTGKIREDLKENEIYLLDVGTELEFRILASADIAKTAVLIVLGNQPLRTPFVQSQQGFFYCSTRVNTPGVFEFALEHLETITKTKKTTKPCQILIQPHLKIQNAIVPPSVISLQSNLSRCLGEISNWKEKILSQVSIGYNLFHITSLQSLGKYNSLYCIGDYLKLNSFFFPEDMPEQEKSDFLHETIEEIEEIGGGLIIDIVITHCSSINPILKEDSNAAYTLKNSSHLTAAYTLDLALQELSKKIAGKKSKYPKGNRIESAKDLEVLMQIIKKKLLKLKMQEFFQIDTEKALTEFVSADFEKKNCLDFDAEFVRKNGFKAFLKKFAVVGLGISRFGARINNERVWAVCDLLGMNKESIIRETAKELLGVNAMLQSKFNRDFQLILKNIEEEILYQKVESRVFEVTEEKPLVKPYFMKLDNGETVLLNGFIINNKDVTRDIAGKQEYFKRNVVCWRDCVKLNYGKSHANSAILWRTIEKYIKTMALLFKGFRLDNCHGLPLHVTQYFLQKARESNPDLLIFAEFFSFSSQVSSSYILASGINYLQSESLNYNSLPAYTSTYKPYNFSIVQPIPSIFFEFTHDNPTLVQCRSTLDSLSNTILASFHNSPVGSTRGYDEIIPIQLSVVDENREYLNYLPIEKDLEHILMGAYKDVVKVVVEYKGFGNSVAIRGDWDGWKSALDMQWINGIWRNLLVFPSSQRGMEYGFKFVIDGAEWVCEMGQRKYKTWDGFFNNLLRVEENLHSFEGVSRNLREFRKKVNAMRSILENEGYSEIEYRVLTGNIVVVERENPLNLHRYVVVANSAMQSGESAKNCEFEVSGYVEKVEFVEKIEVNGVYANDAQWITGVPVKITSEKFEKIGEIRENRVFLNDFPVGSVGLFKVRPLDEGLLIEIMKKFVCLEKVSTMKYALQGLSLEDIAFVLWGDKEKEVLRDNRRPYHVPGFTDLPFNGIFGLVSSAKHENINKTHPIHQNLYAGDWYSDYQVGRIQQVHVKVFYFFIHDTILLIKQLKRDMIPKLLIRFFTLLYKVLKKYTVEALIPCKFPNWFAFSATKVLGKHTEIVDFQYFCKVKMMIHCEMQKEVKDFIVKIASMEKKGKIPGEPIGNYVNSLYFLNLLQEYLVYFPSDMCFLQEKIDFPGYPLKTLTEIVTDLYKTLANSILDQESGVILLPSPQTWAKQSSRTGAPIEIIAFLYSSLDFFSSLSDFPQSFHVNSEIFTLANWKSLIFESFTDLFWIPTSENSRYIRPELCKTRGIYKDTIGTIEESEEYILTPSVLLAMKTAPGLFSEDLATKCLKTIKIQLLPSISGPHTYITAWYYTSALKFSIEPSENAWSFILNSKSNFSDSEITYESLSHLLNRLQPT